MRIKHHKNRNSYILSESGVWVRDLTKTNTPFIDINDLTNNADQTILLNNEIQNKILNLINIDTENFSFTKALIISDGYNFHEYHKLLYELPEDVHIIAVNGALAKWSLVGPNCEPDKKRVINYYLINNPYEESLRFLPKKNKYYPPAIASFWANHDFISFYSQKGDVYEYSPCESTSFSSAMQSSSQYYLDDYRNPVCAALSFAYKCGADKIGFFCCDDSFIDKREGSIKLENGLYTYPQHYKAHSIIDAMLYWIKNDKYNDMEIVDCSSGFEYKNAKKIEKSDFIGFYKNNEQK